ncbi:hypothetical protein RND81_06G234800 [Saponaria officinalis]|uniref:Prokaryotic-type class I peptide chain release factors domain-containing protein n=1 Tax=Saponaria officinalis TaxID=3572 RepID=A0AAW1KEL4_SAPOF
MAAIRTTSTILLQRLTFPAFRNVFVADSKLVSPLPLFYLSAFSDRRNISYGGVRCAAAKKASARLSQVQQVLLESEERAKSAADEPPPPKISLEHVSVSFARSGGPGGQNVNKVNTKVDMRFNVKNASWLSERVRDKIMILEKNRINKEGEIVISSTKTRTQQGNIEDCLSKLQAIINAAAYVPPPPSEEQKKKIVQLAAKSEHKRLQSKKVLSQKKEFRRSKSSWD